MDYTSSQERQIADDKEKADQQMKEMRRKDKKIPTEPKKFLGYLMRKSQETETQDMLRASLTRQKNNLAAKVQAQKESIKLTKGLLKHEEM